jgi:hypothetical protein
MNRDSHFSTRVRLGIVLACVVGAPLELAVAQQAVPERGVVRKGRMGPRDGARIERFTVDPALPGWEIVLKTGDPRLVDLDLFVSGPAGRATSRLCASEGIERVETCRVGQVTSGLLTVEIVATGGVERSEYELTIRALKGERIAGTPLVAEDATSLAPGAWTGAVLTGVSRAGFPPWALYGVSADRLADSRDWIVAATSGDPSVGIDMGVYDREGREIARSDASAAYQDLRVAGPVRERLFVLVTAKRARGPLPAIDVGVFRADAPIPVASRGDSLKRPTQEWIASGHKDRTYELRLGEGETAIVELEGTTGQLSVTSPAGGPVTVKRLFGSAQQVAWIGDPLGQSRHVLTGLTAGRPLVVAVDAPEDTRYGQVAGWTLHIRSSRTQPNYLVQFGMDEVERWDEWWTTSAATRTGTLPPGGVKVLELPPPPDVRRAAAAQQSIAPSTPWEQRVVMLARLAEAGGQLFDLAICTRDGRVLDIEGVAVRWEWLPETGPLYLAIFSDPFGGGQSSGPFRIELTRSLLSGGK